MFSLAYGSDAPPLPPHAGTVPASLSRLASLVELKVCGTALRGSVPPALYAMTPLSLSLSMTISECGLSCEPGCVGTAASHPLALLLCGRGLFVERNGHREQAKLWPDHVVCSPFGGVLPRLIVVATVLDLPLPAGFCATQRRSTPGTLFVRQVCRHASCAMFSYYTFPRPCFCIVLMER